MAQRPNFINLPSGNITPARGSPSSSALPSPRLPRVVGEVAPAMSPLDMFAERSRALARKLEEERRVDRRVSRLPPLTVHEGLARMPGFGDRPKSPIPQSAQSAQSFQSAASSSKSPQREGYMPSPDEPSGSKMEIEEPAVRPKSQYPRFSRVVATPDSEMPRPPPTFESEMFATPMEYPQAGGDYFSGPRTHSPEPSRPERPSLESISQHSSQASITRPKPSFDSVYRSHDLARGLSTESSSSRMSQYSTSLQPPNPNFSRKAPSIRSVSVSSDDENPGITPSSSMSQTRKFSESSNVSLPLSPQSTYSQAHNRSTSQLSEYSINGARLSRPAYNFSRPMSRNSRPSTDSPTRMSSTASHPRIYGDEEIQTPTSVDGLTLGDNESIKGGDVPPNSYIYAKYSLPRGRMLQRDSLPLDKVMPHFKWEQPKVESNVKPIQINQTDKDIPASLPTPPHSIESERAPRTSTESLPNRPPPIPASKDSHRHSMTSMNTQNSGSTIKASQQKRRGSTDMTAEDHLNKGIALHEKGSLNESTYHFRLAARQNNPTAMLMYALACRHGWGMRQNPKEGVTWLRKAMDCASIEMSIDEEGGRPDDAQGQKTRRAQFALSVYELGVSHMNGWGIEQDKFLALRCFEIASSWGDADAMAEAGFCFVQGVGCKKDLKKAAKYYRDAEAKGMSMVGNSWIYKSKYDPDPEPTERTGRSARSEETKDRKKRDKSRTRSIFGRRKDKPTA